MLFVRLKVPRTLVATGLLCFLYLGKVMAVSGKPPESEMVPIIVHHQSATCGNLSESQWISDQQKYESVFQAMFRGFISDSRPQPALVGFDKHAMLLVSMGQQRTGGFSVKLAAEQMEVSNNRARIKVHWQTAKPGMMAIQMLTNPCLLLEVPRGNYELIDIVDQSGKTRQSIAVDHG